MMNYYPNGTTVTVKLEEYLYKTKKMDVNNHMCVRMIKTATLLEADGHIGWQMYIPKKGMAELALFGCNSIQKKDLEWISESIGKKSAKETSKEIAGKYFCTD